MRIFLASPQQPSCYLLHPLVIGKFRLRRKSILAATRHT
jgi:hypothetical protein